MGANQLIQILIYRLPDTGFGQFVEGFDRCNDLQVHFFSVAAVNNANRPGTEDPFGMIVRLTAERRGNSFQGFLGGRKPDSNGLVSSKRHQPLQRQAQVNPAFVAADGVYFINNDILQWPKQIAAPFSAKQQIQ